MAKFIKDSYLLSKEEYEKLTNPDTTYTLLTKTAANKMVAHLLKATEFTCWHDDPDVWMDDFCCSLCPVYKLLGSDAVSRVCLRQKVWGQ